MSRNFLSCSKGLKDPWNFQRLGVISLETPRLKWASSHLDGRTSWIFSSCHRCSGLTTGTSGTRSGGLRKGQSPCELLGGISGFLTRRCCGQGLVWSRFWNLRISPSADLDLGVLLESPQGSQSSSRGEACTCVFLPSCSSSVALPFAWIKGSVAFPRGFPTRLSHRSVLGATMVRVDARLESRGSARKTGFP